LKEGEAIVSPKPKPKLNLPCVAKVLPLKPPGKMRACGMPATSLVEGRPLCPRHGRVARQRVAERNAHQEGAAP
jgi:hypothetical protein